MNQGKMEEINSSPPTEEPESRGHFLNVFVPENAHEVPTIDPFQLIKFQFRVVYGCLIVLAILQGSAYLVFSPRPVTLDSSSPALIHPTTQPTTIRPTFRSTTRPTTTTTRKTTTNLANFNVFCPKNEPEIVRGLAGKEPRFIAVCPRTQTLAFVGGDLASKCPLNVSSQQIFYAGQQLFQPFVISKKACPLPISTPILDDDFAVDEVLANFTKINATDRASVVKFVADNFDQSGHELQACQPSDWRETSGKFSKIKDDRYRDWANKIHAIWKDLCREMKPGVDIARCTLIPLPHPFIIPGGRFREAYYWDSYWIIKGLIASEMYQTAENMIRNLAKYIDDFGMIPNGGRIYYAKRSQPPTLAMAVKDYYDATKNLSVVLDILELLDVERRFWEKQRTVNVTAPNGKSFEVFVYAGGSNTPRPESYNKDIETAEGVTDPASRAKLFQCIAATAESGWDFSSRWLNGDKASLNETYTADIVPVDLNGFLYANALILSELHRKAGNISEAEAYDKKASYAMEAIEALFWNDTIGSYFDYWPTTMKHNSNYYTSNVVPLFVGIADARQKERRILAAMNESGALSYEYGVPSSMLNTAQQWDMPNAWANQIHMLVESFRTSQNPELQAVGFDIAQRWLRVNYAVYNLTSHMFEKYRVDEAVGPGHGGEYEVQTGFGWTNGVALDLLVSYADKLTSGGPLVDPVEAVTMATPPKDGSHVTAAGSRPARAANRVHLLFEIALIFLYGILLHLAL